MPRRPFTPPPCCVCGAPGTKPSGLLWTCDEHAEPLRQALIDKRDAMLAELRQMAAERMNQKSEVAA